MCANKLKLRSARRKFTKNDRPPFWLYRESIRNRDIISIHYNLIIISTYMYVCSTVAYLCDVQE